ncbi:MAG: hypothetical protein R2712_02630 [Vicinamibacterales bacterium]
MPLRPDSEIRASTVPLCPSGRTMFNPNPIVPSGLGVAMPTSGARCAAPHWSSNPSSVYTAPS